jgi:SWI/SNF-related matrix-associated actin-dependent regulator 1 of chromatin subfamily A
MEGDIFVFQGGFQNKHLPKEAKFRWNPDRKHWWTDDIDKAVKLYEIADEKAKQKLAPLVEDRSTAVAASRAVAPLDPNLEIPAPEGLEYLPYQLAGIHYAIEHLGSINGDDPGLGKTIQAIGLINAIKPRRVLIVSPANLRITPWQVELAKWLVNDYTVGIIRNGKDPWPEADIVVMSYEMLKKHHEEIRKITWDLFVVDEAHYLKNLEAQRTIEAFGSKKRLVPPVRSHRTMLLTGTPFLNRPVELWPLVHYLDPITWSNKWRFEKRYCDGHFEQVYVRGGGRIPKKVWIASGSSHLAELQERLRSTVMIRRLKQDVLKELPPKRRQIIEFPTDGCKNLLKQEAKEWESLKKRYPYYSEAEMYKASFEEMSEVRRELSLRKVVATIVHLQELLETGIKVVCFAWHRDTVHAIAAAFPDQVVTLMGGDGPDHAQEAVDQFQHLDSIKLFVGNIKAAGVGLTLTASSHVVFAEFDWVPGNLRQAEDRCHRIGQHDSVNIQYLVFSQSLDAKMLKDVLLKEAVFHEGLDKVHTPKQLEVNEEPSKRDLPAIPPEQIQAIHLGLRTLAGMCDGARLEDGMGFNKLDTNFGKQLAASKSLTLGQAHWGRKLVGKYQRQLPADLLEAAGVQPKGEAA